MYTKNITAKVSVVTKDIVCRLADDMGITISEFSRIAIEKYVVSTLKSILVERGFDEENALSLLECMNGDRVVDVSIADDIILAYRAFDGHVVEATRDDIERALADVEVIVASRKRGDVVTMQNGKAISGDNPLLIVAGYDKDLGVMVIA